MHFSSSLGRPGDLERKGTRKNLVPIIPIDYAKNSPKDNYSDTFRNKSPNRKILQDSV